MNVYKAITILFATGFLAACGAAGAARETGQVFDNLGCLSRDFKGQPACEGEP